MVVDVVAAPCVIVSEIECDQGNFIGHIQLNSPKSLNAIDLDMVDIIARQIELWRYDDRIVAIWLDAAGDKAFAPGGDIRKLYHSMQDDEERTYAKDFFQREYTLNYRVHIYPKPIIAWGFGFIMGGGLGLFVGASHRIVTQTAMIAWPEITIGLFPDVSASYFLSRMPEPVGKFVGLTGARLNATDAISVNLADYHIRSNQKKKLLAQLQALPWTSNKAMNNSAISALITTFEPKSSQWPISHLNNQRELIDQHFSAAQVQDIVSAVETHQENKTLSEAIIDTSVDNKITQTTTTDQSEVKSKEKSLKASKKQLQADESDAWFNLACENLLKGNPSTACIVMRQIQKGSRMTLKEVVKMENMLANQSILKPDFSAGIKAQIIDRSAKPDWKYKRVGDVPKEWIDGFFTPPWSSDEDHPLADL
jgi:enoyl-CoA hydratase/carnithine racemase